MSKKTVILPTKKEKIYIVQKFSSRFETPRMKIDNEVWEHTGLAPFSTDHVPYSGRTGFAYADKIVKLLVTRLAQVERQSEMAKIDIYEFGTGTGLLSKHMLDLLKIHHPSVYQRVTIHLSDISETAIKRLRESKVHKDHEDHVAYDIIDAAEPRFPCPPFLVFHTYLVDSMPTRHIEISENQIWEVQIQTSVKAGSSVIDTTDPDLPVLDEKAISELLNGSDVQRRLLLAPKLLNAIDETPMRVPIENVKNMAQDERHRIQELATKLKKDGRFNYSYMVDRSCQKIMKCMANGGILLISDYGKTVLDFTPPEYLLVSFGTTATCLVNFDILLKIGEMTSAYTSLTHHPEGRPQEILWDTWPDPILKRKFEAVFGKNAREDLVGEFLLKAEQSLNKKGSQRTKEIKILSRYDKLPHFSKMDYQLLNNLANLFMKASFFEAAIRLSSLLLDDSSHVSGPTYRVRAQAYSALGKNNLAKQDLKSALLISAVDSGAYYMLSQIYAAEGNDQLALTAKRLQLNCTRETNILPILKEIEALERRTKQIEKAKKTQQHITRLSKIKVQN